MLRNYIFVTATESVPKRILYLLWFFTFRTYRKFSLFFFFFGFILDLLNQFFVFLRHIFWQAKFSFSFLGVHQLLFVLKSLKFLSKILLLKSSQKTVIPFDPHQITISCYTTVCFRNSQFLSLFWLIFNIVWTWKSHWDERLFEFEMQKNVWFFSCEHKIKTSWRHNDLRLITFAVKTIFISHNFDENMRLSLRKFKIFRLIHFLL